MTFKVLRKYIEEKYGEDKAKDRIFVTTDKEKGVLKKLADEKGYETFVVPDDIGGRYSVFTAVGLLPIASAGINIDRLLDGVYSAEKKYSSLENNDCYDYAVARNIMYKKKKKIELLVNYEPKLHYISEWWKQLFGESEGKEEKGIFPASVDNTTDLHSMGQYIQEGERILFETVINIKKPYRDFTLTCEEGSPDALDYLNGKKEILPTTINLTELFQNQNSNLFDFSEVKGQENIKRALEIAAAGGHNCLLIRNTGVR